MATAKKGTTIVPIAPENGQIMNSSSNKAYRLNKEANLHLLNFARKNSPHYNLGSKI